MTRLHAHVALEAPYRVRLRYYRCGTPYRAILLEGGWQLPRKVRCPPLGGWFHTGTSVRNLILQHIER